MKIILIACALTSAVAGPVLAQEAGPAGLTRDQVIAVAAATFDQLDLNHDGVITRAEAEQARAALGKEPDNNGSKKAEEFLDLVFAAGPQVDQKTFVAAAVARFDANDPNHDGVITFAEHDAQKGADPK
jgi:hypothetical protein